MLLPTWKFFDKAGHMPILQFRLESKGSNTGNVGKWENVLVFSRDHRIPLINAEGNFNLYKQGIVQKFTQSLSENAGYEQSDFFPLVRRMAQQKILETYPSLQLEMDNCRNCFRLRVIESDTSFNETMVGLFFESDAISFEKGRS